MELQAGSDFREARYRPEVFLRFYTWTLKYRSHPGGVYYVLPYLADQLGWDAEQRAWCAFLNGNTQNPVTTLLLMSAGDRPDKAEAVVAFWRRHYANLLFDTDRRHQKSKLEEAVDGYVAAVGDSQERFWQRAASGGWEGVWRAAYALPHMGRLSAWSYLEYLRILRVGGVPDADTLMLGDRSGSRSHRNGLCLVAGMDDWIWWDYNPGFGGHYDREVLKELEDRAAGLLYQARQRNPEHPDVGYLTLESAFCTYKSWHRPNRRYPGVYNDLLYDRLRHAEARFGNRFGIIWDARRAALPEHLRLEDSPLDPGAVPAKQNWYRETGQPIMMARDWGCFENGFEKNVFNGAYGIRRS